MRTLFIFLAVSVCAFSALARQTSRLQMPDRRSGPAEIRPTLPIRKVILYSNGVAYIERRGKVSGNAQIDLSFKQSQVDDVLKSMVVLDLGQGKIGAVSYNSSAPASARTAEIPFNINAQSGDTDSEAGGLANVLTQLQGARVTVMAGKGTATGSILTVEKKKIPGKDEKSIPTAAYALVISSEAGEIMSFDLGDIKSVKLIEDNARHDVNEFANATASTRRRDAKTISITSDGVGERQMIVSYTVAAPIWKTTYRVALDQDGKPFFQGWAIVDNVSDDDWQNVELSLVSGSPVSFIQNLQKPLYRYRPIIPIPEDLNLEPQVYDADSVGVGVGSGSGTGNGAGGGYGRGQGVNETVDVTAASELSAVRTSISDLLTNQQSGVQTAASGTELGDLFEYRIDNPVTVQRNRSALIPIVQTRIDGERVSIYNQSAREDRPMGGMMLTNTTPLTFEGGSLTVLDRDAYAGEAIMERLKPKEQRLISFALDLGTKVSVENSGDNRPAQLVKAVDGSLQVHYFRTEKKIYHLVNQTDRQKVVFVEHPVRKDWGLSEDTPRPETTTDKVYRFRVLLKPFAREELPVTERQGLMDTYSLSNFTSDQLRLFVTRKYIDAATEARLRDLLDLRNRIAEIDTRITELNNETQRIEADQKRFRENIEALTKTPEAKTLITRYIAKAGDQETRVEEIERLRKEFITQKEQLNVELASLIKNFEIK